MYPMTVVLMYLGIDNSSWCIDNGVDVPNASSADVPNDCRVDAPSFWQ